jgi:periplasmic protein CpxP/Spy
MLALQILCAATVATLIALGVGHAQSSSPAAPVPQALPPAPPSTSQPAPPALSAAAEAAIDQRIHTLQSQLGITPGQMPLWSAFAHAMRENAQSTNALFAQRAGAVAMMSAVDNMDSYARIARVYADNTERLATAFDSLYASLSPTQKQAADTIFRQQATAAAKPRR